MTFKGHRLEGVEKFTLSAGSLLTLSQHTTDSRSVAWVGWLLTRLGLGQLF